MGGLTEEQKRRIEENRKKALQKRAQNAAQTSSSSVGNQLVKRPFAQGPAAGGSGNRATNNTSYNSNKFKPFTASKPTTVVQKSPVKWGVPPNAKESKNQTQAACTSISSATVGTNSYSSSKAFTSIHPPSSSSTSSSSGFVQFNKGSNSKLDAASISSNSKSNAASFSSAKVGTDSSSSSKTFTSIHPPSSSSTSSSSGFVQYKGSNLNSKSDAAKSTTQFYSKNISSIAMNSGQKSSNPTSFPVQASKSTSNFYSSKPAASTTSKPSFTSSNYGNKNNTFSQSANKSQKPWQKSQPFGAASSSSGSSYGGGLTGKCVLASRKSFLVDVVFHAKLIEIFKQMSTKSYDAATKKWSFALSEYDQLMDAVKCLRPAVDIEPLPKSITIAFRNQRKGKDTTREIPEANLNSVDSHLVNALMPFQRDGVNFAVAHEGRVLIADDMGLGKTIQAICIAYYYRTEWPLLIVTPSSLRYSWAEALEKWLPSLDPDLINVVLKGKDNASAGLVNIISYDLMARQVDKLSTVGFQVIIFDESHFMKNIKTARSKAALAILKNAPRVILLSGTPALSRPAELFTQAKAVRPNLFPSHFHDFGVRYCDGKKNPWGWDYSGSSNLCELQLLLEETIMIRRLKADVLPQLPSKTRQMVLMDPQTVKTSSKALKNAAKEMTQKKKGEQRGALMQYFNETGHAKIPAIKDYVGDLLESGCKAVVFGHHQLVLDAICECVQSKKQGYIRIDGSTSAANRKLYVDKFQSDDACRIAVLSITAANSGFTMTASSLVVFAELFWNPGIMIQAEDRVHRIGQKDCVNIRYLIAKGTADDYIWPLVQKKLGVLEKAGLSKDDFSKADTTTFQDPRQRTILSFFEQSFFEEDDESAAAELAALEAAEADGTASQTPEDVPSQDSTIQSHDPPKKQIKEDISGTSKQPGKSSFKSNVEKPTSDGGTEIKRLAKSTQRKLDQWRTAEPKVEPKVESKSEPEETFEDEVLDDLMTDYFDLDSAVLEEDSDGEDSPSLFQTGKRQKTQFSGAQKQGGFVPPYKKQRNL